jgi:hypothetical protein
MSNYIRESYFNNISKSFYFCGSKIIMSQSWSIYPNNVKLKEEKFVVWSFSSNSLTATEHGMVFSDQADATNFRKLAF